MDDPPVEVLLTGSRAPRGDLLNVLDTVAEKGAAFRSLGDPWADTTTVHGRLILTVLGSLAEFERELIRARTGEGRARAKAAGVKMGRPWRISHHYGAAGRTRPGEALAQKPPRKASSKSSRAPESSSV